ncbi:MAG: hypothetical protein E7599_01745 [Ruminococcaceae bacterium]|nr:hypothetical protein [Oscillospiraceae bacterium]
MDNELCRLAPRAADLCRQAGKNGVAAGDFLTLAEQAYLKSLQDGGFDREMLTFFGGYGEAERRVMVFISEDHRARLQSIREKQAQKTVDWDSIDWEKDDWWQQADGLCEESPRDAVSFEEAGIAVLGVSVPKGAQLPGHRDFLGALLALGLDRRALGDIVPFEGKTYLFVKKSVADYLVNSMDRVGKSPVSVEKVTLPTHFAPERAFEETVLTVAGLRLDGLVAAITGLSREEAKNTVIHGLVNRNYLPETRPETLLCEGDVLSVKGSGRFVLQRIAGQTKKGRLKIVLQKYV